MTPYLKKAKKLTAKAVCLSHKAYRSQKTVNSSIFTARIDFVRAKHQASKHQEIELGVWSNSIIKPKAACKYNTISL